MAVKRVSPGLPGAATAALLRIDGGVVIAHVTDTRKKSVSVAPKEMKHTLIRRLRGGREATQSPPARPDKDFIDFRTPSNDRFVPKPVIRNRDFQRF
jgi:hypothetical protein